MKLSEIPKLVINLPERTDRLELLKKELEGWDYEIVPGIKLPNPVLGIAQAHINCVKLAKERGWEQVLIMEDDLVLRKGAEEYFNKAIENAPEWDILLGGLYNCKSMAPVNDYWNRCGEFCGLHFYLIKGNGYERMLTHNGNSHIDRWLNKKNQGCRTFVTKKFISTQRDGFSDNKGKVVQYQDYLKNFELL